MDEGIEKKAKARKCTASTYLTSLRSVRRQRALTQRQLAARAGTGQRTISKLERLEREAHASTVQKLATALRVTPVELMRERPP